MDKFEEMKNLKRDFSFGSCQILIKIINMKDIVFLTRAKIAKQINVHQGNPQFNEIINYLKDLQIIIKENQLGNNEILKIDKINLMHFIDEQDLIVKLVDNYYKKYHNFKW